MNLLTRIFSVYGLTIKNRVSATIKCAILPFHLTRQQQIFHSYFNTGPMYCFRFGLALLEQGILILIICVSILNLSDFPIFSFFSERNKLNLTKNQKSISFTNKIEDHDLKSKLKSMKKWLVKGHTVKASCYFESRQR